MHSLATPCRQLFLDMALEIEFEVESLYFVVRALPITCLCVEGGGGFSERSVPTKPASQVCYTKYKNHPRVCMHSAWVVPRAIFTLGDAIELYANVCVWEVGGGGFPETSVPTKPVSQMCALLHTC